MKFPNNVLPALRTIGYDAAPNRSWRGIRHEPVSSTFRLPIRFTGTRRAILFACGNRRRWSRRRRSIFKTFGFPVLPELSSVDHTIHPRPRADRIEQGPVTLFDDVSLGKRRARLLAERSHHAVVAIVAKQHHADQCRERRTADFTKGGGYLGAALRAEIGEGATGKRGQVRQRAAYVVMVALQASEDGIEDQFVVGARHVIGLARRDDGAGQRAQVAGLFGGEVIIVHGNRSQSNRLARRCLMLSAM